MPVRHSIWVLLTALAALFSGASAATADSGATHPHVQVVQQLLSIPEADIDFAAAKVTIDRLIDPGIDADATLRQIDQMAAEIRSNLAFRSAAWQRADSLRAYLYDPGPCNKGRTFAYDLADPLGKHIPNKLLANYLRTRRGNCISMPFLYIALAQKLGLAVGAATSPNHVFVKLRDEQGHWHNIETVSGGYPRRDSLYHNDTPMTPQSIANGIYMRPLGKRETVAVMATLLLEHYSTSDTPQPERVIAIADVVLKHDPINVSAMLAKGWAYQDIRSGLCPDHGLVSRLPTERERQTCMALRRANLLWYAKAEALGRREPPPDQLDKYLDMVKGLARSQKQERQTP